MRCGLEVLAAHPTNITSSGATTNTNRVGKEGSISRRSEFALADPDYAAIRMSRSPVLVST